MKNIRSHTKRKGNKKCNTQNPKSETNENSGILFLFSSSSSTVQSRLEKCQNYATLELKDAAEQWWWTSHTYLKTHTRLSTTKTLIHRQQGCPLISRSVKCALSWWILKMKWIFVKIYRMKYPIEKKIFKYKKENCTEFLECFRRIQMFLC